MRFWTRAIFAAALIFATGCGVRHKSTTVEPPSTPSRSIFTDVAADAGIHFTHDDGVSGHFYVTETMPAGCAFLDYDNDGRPDILLVQSGPSTLTPLSGGEGQGERSSTRSLGGEGARPTCRLYHNVGAGKFVDVTAGSGLDKDLGYAMGVAVGDYDNDGYDDILITGYDRLHLFHNEHGTGKFVDVTDRMGLGNVRGFSTSAAFGDYDNDGRLDLFVCYYTPWSPSIEPHCTGPSGQDYCSPALYPTVSDRLFHNDGARFTDVTQSSGIGSGRGHGLACAFLDYNGDGRQDIFVANDQTPNQLWRNDGHGHFTDAALDAGVAYSDSAKLMSGMGIALGDYDHSGRESLFVTNYSGLPNTLWKNTGKGLFDNVSNDAGVAEPHMPYLSFGCDFIDYDADGRPDLITANGHVQTQVAQTTPGTTYAERKQLFHNLGNGKFEEVADPSLLGPLSTPTVARGLAVGDFDDDGRLDVLVNNQNGPAQLFHNNDRNGNHWISFKTIGTRSNRDGYHARITITVGGIHQMSTVHAGTSYLSHSDSRVYFGLGPSTKVDTVEIDWPSGTRDKLKNVAVDAIYVVTEGKGITGKQSDAGR